MEQRLSLVTLGVSDLARSRAFYEALGWKSGAAPADDVVFFQAHSSGERINAPLLCYLVGLARGRAGSDLSALVDATVGK